MFFIILTFAAALFIEGLGSLVSVIGISALFGANPIIIALAIALDVGKIVVVSLLYTYWKDLSKLMKSYALVAAAVTMTITSAGAAGYLSGEFQKAILGTKEGELKVSVLKEQQTRLLERKKQIDDQIAKLPSNYSRSRITLMKQFEGEQKAVTEQLATIDRELPALQITQIGTEAKAGPILYVAKAFDVPVEQAVKWVILMIIFVFDPLAIFLIIAGNFLWAHRKSQKETPLQEKLAAYDPVKHSVVEEPLGPQHYVPDPEEEAFHAEQQRKLNEDPQPPIFERLYPSVKEGDSLPPVVFPVESSKEEPPQPEPEDEFLEVSEVPEVKREDVQVMDNVDLPTPAEEPAPQTGLTSVVSVDAPPVREQITKSSLGLIKPDPNTVVDARTTTGFKRASSITTPEKK
jgi:hypothetical protein